MNANLKRGILLVGICATLGLIYSLNEYTGPFTITGKVSNVTYVETKLDPGLTIIIFNDGRTISFSGDLMFDVGRTYAITYHKYGLVLELVGRKSVNVVDRYSVIS